MDTFRPENCHRFSYNFNFQGRIYLTVESAFFAKYQNLNLPFYGINQGTVGFLMNQKQDENIINKLNEAEETVIHPLKMHAKNLDGTTEHYLAVNEISILR